MSDDPTPEDEDAYRAWRQRVLDEVLPMVEESTVAVALIPRTEADIKMAVELGMMVLLDKPIIAVVSPGVKVPAKLVAVADRIVEGSTDEPDVLAARVREALESLHDGDS